MRHFRAYDKNDIYELRQNDKTLNKSQASINHKLHCTASFSVRPTCRLRTIGGFKRKFTEVGWRFPIASPQTKSTSNSYLSCSGLLSESVVLVRHVGRLTQGLFLHVTIAF